MRRVTWTLLVVLSLVAIGCSPVVVGDWTMLGERVVNDRAERDSITVGADEGRFTALKLRALRRPVHILDVKVHFGDGRVQDVAVRRIIRAGGESRVIDLSGGARVIRRVEFTYEAESRGRGRRATLQLFGRH